MTHPTHGLTDPHQPRRRAAGAACLAVLVAAAACGAEVRASDVQAGRDRAATVSEAAGVSGGLCVMAGGEAKLAAELVRGGKFLVVMLAPEGKVDAARRSLQAWGRYGPATVQEAPRGRLPFTEGLVNLIVVDDLKQSGLAVGEILRALCPGGTALLAADAAPQGMASNPVTAEGRRWIRIRKPVPDALDVWTHPRYDASGNAVSSDAVAAPPGRIRWIAGPPTGRNTMITVGGRCFYGEVAARDAFNGLALWSRPLRSGGVRAVASDSLVFAVHERKLLGLDPATGQTVRAYPAAGAPLEVRHADGTLVTLNHTSVRAVDVGTGRRLWSRGASIPGCMAIGEGAVFYIDGNPRRGEKSSIVAIDLKSGQTRWKIKMRLHRKEPDTWEWLPRATGCSYHSGTLAFEESTWSDFADGNTVHAVSAKDGGYLWSKTFQPHGAHRKQARALFTGAAAWVVRNRKIEELDPATGETKREIPGGSGHCYPPVATRRYL
ncbi:MAG: outer membrane protein assembly factor BamB family protein, partial [Planctomycetota bacterium]